MWSEKKNHLNQGVNNKELVNKNVELVEKYQLTVIPTLIMDSFDKVLYEGCIQWDLYRKMCP